MTHAPDPKDWDPSDKRRQPRAPLLVLRVSLSDETRTFFGYAKNLSRSGVFIATVTPRDLGSRFILEIPLPNALGIHLNCECEVVWRRKYEAHSPYEPGMGLHFIDLDEKVVEYIDHWVREEIGESG